MKKRADLILVNKNIAESRNKAQAMIRAGQIYINGKKILKSGELCNLQDDISYTNVDFEWVSRGALKLLHALDYFKIDVEDYICLDIGASTGGFTEVLLSRNAKKIYCVDVGKNQLHKKLINNLNIVNIPQTNARYLNQKIIPELVNIIVCDVSFISMKKVILPSLPLLEKNSGIVIALIKPQFELEKQENRKNGIVIDKKIHQKICSDYENWFSSECGMQVLGLTPSPINGQKGNIEFLICAKSNYK